MYYAFQSRHIPSASHALATTCRVAVKLAKSTNKNKEHVDATEVKKEKKGSDESSES